MFRDLLVHVDGSTAGRRRVQFAVDLARRTEARLSGLHVRPPAEVPTRYKPSRVADVATNIAARLVLDAHAAAMVFREEAPGACWLEAAGEVVECISEKARYADMVIIGQYEWQGPAQRHPLPIAHSLVLQCGRPVLVVPALAQPCVFARTAVAWDGSREAVRSVHDALPLLSLSKSVDIVTMIPPSAKEDEVDATSLSAHLSHHGIKVGPKVLHITTSDERTELQNEINQGRYDLLVMGGYSHAMWFEFIFGGATQSMLLSSEIPILVSH
jgi:nucleotide-binding universal stress UspA family protein